MSLRPPTAGTASDTPAPPASPPELDSGGFKSPATVSAVSLGLPRKSPLCSDSP